MFLFLTKPREGVDPAPTLTPTVVQAKARPERALAERFGQTEKTNVPTTTKIGVYLVLYLVRFVGQEHGKRATGPATQFAPTIETKS